MRTISKYLLAATLAVAFVASADAQGQRRGGGAGGQPPGGRGQGGGFGFGGGGLTTLVVNKSVLEEIKATDEQKEKLAKWAPEASTKQQEKMRELRGDGQPDFAKIAEANAAIAKEQLEEVSKVLKEDQVKRVKQIQVQIASVNAFRQKDVQDGLKLTDEQKETIREIQMSMGQEMGELFPMGGGGGGARPSPEAQAERTKKINELNKKFLDKILAQLKDDQKKSYEEMTGKAFEYKPEPPRRRDN